MPADEAVPAIVHNVHSLVDTAPKSGLGVAAAPLLMADKRDATCRGASSCFHVGAVLSRGADRTPEFVPRVVCLIVGNGQN